MTTESIPASITLKSLIDTELRHDPFGTFDRYPFTEVREAFIAKYSGYANRRPADVPQWIEDHITALWKQCDPLWLKMLEWYLFPPSTSFWRDCHCPVGFAIGIWFEEGLEKRHIFKAIIAALKRAAYLYWHDERVEDFVLEVINDLQHPSGGAYSETAWMNFERIVKLVMEVKDILILPHLEKTLSMLKAREINPEYFASDPFIAKDHLHFLESRLEKFRWAAIATHHNLAGAEALIRSRARIPDDVPITFSLPIPAEAIAGSEVKVPLRLEGPSAEITAKLRRAFKNFPTTFTPAGFSSAEMKHDAQGGYLILIPSRGSNRLKVRIAHGNYAVEGTFYMRGLAPTSAS